jgi:alpha-1,2-mannosyltransferase
MFVRMLAFPRSRLLWAGAAAFTLVVAGWVAYWLLIPYTAVFPVDLTVYLDGGLIAREVAPYYDPHAAAPLYDWGGYSDLALKFTYTPFAAVAFAVASFASTSVVTAVSVVASITALVGALWFTLGGLSRQAGGLSGHDGPGERDPGGHAGLVPWDRAGRAGVTLLCAAAVFWTQPVLRNLNLGQINVVLMALILWDLCQPGTRRSGKARWWKGFATGVAAGIKLVPLIFVPYLVATRRLREAAATLAGFAFTIAVGFAVLPKDSADWWLDGVFAQGSRTGFVGWAGNQSLYALFTRLSGSIAAGTVPWLAAAAVAGVTGITAAAVLSRAGHEVPALLLTALTGLLMSPISWDHHWVWITPGFLTAVVYARRYWRAARRRAWWLIGLATGLLIVFGGWPDALWEKARNLGRFSLGFLWAPPNTNPILYVEHGDQPSFVEYHWHGLWLLAGNAYILAGMAIFLALCGVAVAVRGLGREDGGLPAEPAVPAATGNSKS